MDLFWQNKNIVFIRYLIGASLIYSLFFHNFLESSGCSSKETASGKNCQRVSLKEFCNKSVKYESGSVLQ